MNYSNRLHSRSNSLHLNQIKIKSNSNSFDKSNRDKPISSFISNSLKKRRINVGLATKSSMILLKKSLRPIQTPSLSQIKSKQSSTTKKYTNSMISGLVSIRDYKIKNRKIEAEKIQQFMKRSEEFHLEEGVIDQHSMSIFNKRVDFGLEVIKYITR